MQSALDRIGSRSRTRCLCVAALAFSFAAASWAQTNDEGLANLQFNFLNPGARALGMGGAFVAMADDATTALANPAGLINLTRPEAAFELTSTRFANEVPWTSGEASAVFDIDTHTLSEFSYSFDPNRFPATISGLSFLSLVYPLRPRSLVISGFYDGQTRYERRFTTNGIEIQDRREHRALYSTIPVDSDLSYQQHLFGASIATRLGNRISIGGTAALADFSISGRTIRDPDSGSPTPDVQTLSGRDRRLTATIGFILRATSRLRVAAVYTRRPAFQLQFDPGPQAAPAGVKDRGGPVRLDIPDRIAIGCSWRADDRLLINVDVVRVISSDLMRGYYNAFYYPGSADPFREQQYAGRAFYEVKDGTELRAGFEWVRIVRMRPLALRAGYWREPFHRMVRKQTDNSVVYDLSRPGEWHHEPYTSRSLIEVTHHVTFGIGLALRRFSIDTGYDYSSASRRLVISGVYYF